MNVHTCPPGRFWSKPGPLGGNFVLKFLIFYYKKAKPGPLAHFSWTRGEKYELNFNYKDKEKRLVKILIKKPYKKDL